jgi:hypothetical protein
MPPLPPRAWPRALCVLAGLPAVLLAQTSQPKADEPVQLPPFNVTAPSAPLLKFQQAYEKLNHRFDGPFPGLRSGPMIEAILWRHKYLKDHPGEDAIIVTTQTGTHLRSATTVYTQAGQVYASSNALGERVWLKKFKPADLNRPQMADPLRSTIVRLRMQYSDARNPRDPVSQPPDTDDFEYQMAGGPPTYAQALIHAEDTGDFDQFRQMAGPATQLDPDTPPAIKSLVQPMLNRMNREYRDAFTQAFFEPSPEVLSWTYAALRDPGQAGVVPVSMARVNFGETSGHTVVAQALIFDWDGHHYVYEPDLGTFVGDFPPDPVTGRPYLCLQGGDMAECVYFCATYLRAHPAEKAIILPGQPTAVAFTVGDRVELFGLALAPFPLPKAFGPASLADSAPLAKLRDRLEAEIARRLSDPTAKTVPTVIPAGQVGDDGDMQVRRAYVALQEAGVPSTLAEDAGPRLTFTWNNMSYVFGPGPEVQPAAAPKKG